LYTESIYYVNSVLLVWFLEFAKFSCNCYLIEYLYALIRHPSCYSCVRVNTLKSTSDAVIQKLMAIMKETEHDDANENLSKYDANVNADTGLKQKVCLKETNISLNLSDCSKVTNALKENFQTGPISKCQVPGLDYVLFVRGSGPHVIDYGYTHEKPPKEVIVSRKCAEAVLRGAQVSIIFYF
jgi:hypothetical protein